MDEAKEWFDEIAGQIAKRLIVLYGDDEDMTGEQWAFVQEGDELPIPVYEIGSRLASDD